MLTNLIGKKRESYFLNELIRSRDEILSSEIVIIPYHQESRDHWSVLALYPNISIIIHYDCLPNAAADNALMRSMSLLLAKLTKNSERGNERKWHFLPLHKCCNIPVRTDDISCRLHTCIFSYSLLLSMEFAIKEELYPMLYYWIAHHAMKGAMCNIQRPMKDSRTLWDDVKCKPARIAILENIPTHKEGPFTSLSTFLRDKGFISVHYFI